MPTKSIDRRHADPMHEIDLLLLEDFMARRDFDPGKGARTLQTMVMLLLLLAVGVIFAHSFSPGDVQSAAAVVQSESRTAAGLLSMPGNANSR